MLNLACKVRYSGLKFKESALKRSVRYVIYFPGQPYLGRYKIAVALVSLLAILAGSVP